MELFGHFVGGKNKTPYLENYMEQIERINIDEAFRKAGGCGRFQVLAVVVLSLLRILG